MTRLTEFAPAKINLALHVTGQRHDGYHLLDTLVCFAKQREMGRAAAGDVLHCEPTNTTTLDINGPFAAGLSNEDNLVLQAVSLVRDKAPQLPHLKFTLEKNLPIASGIGGGSADAAAALRLCNRILVDPLPQDEILTLAANIGADVPMCFMQQAAIATGIGEHLQGVPLPILHLLQVNPAIAVSTPPVFKQLTVKSNPPLEPFGDSPTRSEWLAWLKRQRNDLQNPAIALFPQIGSVLEEIDALPSVSIARMSGSGATCFGVFPTSDTAEEAGRLLQQQHPDWWICATSTTPNRLETL